MRIRFGFLLGSIGVTLAACSSPPPGLAPSDLKIQFQDGPADHVAGNAIPEFTVWVVDLFDRRATFLDGGTLTLDLIDPSGAIQTNFASAPLSFGQAVVNPTTTLPQGTGYSMRGTFENATADAPPFDVVASSDVVQLTNPSSGEMGLMVDGANNIVRIQDAPFRTFGTEVEVGALNSGTLTQGVGVFAPDRRPEFVPVTWTPGVDALPITLQAPVAIPVTVWVIGGTFATEMATMQQTIADLNAEWRKERMGVEITDVRYMDATSQEADHGFFAVGMGAPFGNIGMGVGREFGRYNLYVVTQVRDATGELAGGFSEQNGTAMALTAADVGPEGAALLAHQFGHNFGLLDTDNIEGFLLEPNAMLSGVSSTVFTEGQILRAHFNGPSSLRQFRTGDTFQPLSCDPFEASTHCPEAAYRIWTEIEPAQVSRVAEQGGAIER